MAKLKIGDRVIITAPAICADHDLQANAIVRVISECVPDDVERRRWHVELPGGIIVCIHEDYLCGDELMLFVMDTRARSR